MKILIAEDNEKMRTYIKKLLVRHLPQLEAIYECCQRDEAIEIYARYRPDWVIMDLRLTGTDGLNATDEILHSDPMANIIMVSQYDDPEYRKIAQKTGAIGFVIKDNLSDIIQIIQRNEK